MLNYIERMVLNMNNKIIGTRIKEMRKSKKITQKQLAEILNKSESSIQKYESGEVEIPQSVLDEIAKALDTNLLYLFGYDAEKLEDELNELHKDLTAKENESTELRLFREQLEQLGYYFQMTDCSGLNMKQSCYLLSYNGTTIKIPAYEFEDLNKSFKSYMEFLLQELMKKYQ